LKDYVCYSAYTHNSSPQGDSLQKGSSGTPYPLVNDITYNNFSHTHKDFLAAITKIIESRYYHEVTKDPR